MRDWTLPAYTMTAVHTPALRRPRAMRTVVAALTLTLGVVTPRPAPAQDTPDATPRRGQVGPWRDPQADTLVARAIARRGLQLADSSLLSYRADAHGFLAFLAQLGEGVVIPPRVVQSEELALQIAWWQPGRSAQRLVGRRDTTLLPADVGYYRDRYGVVLDNLPDRIRLGDGQDVRDVAHPLGATAPQLYEYTMGSAVRIGLQGREILVDEVKFRPRNGSLPGAIGSVYLDRETAAVVRLSMTFTRAAILDRRIETLVVTLENGLVRDKYWLPRRQEVEVSRGSTWFDIPARGIVRGRWEISNYDVNERIPPETMALPRWSSAPRDSLRAHPFEGRVVDALPPEIQVASSEDVVRARVQAENAVRAAMLARPATASVTGRGISDFARYSRAEGLALGVGGAHTTRSGLLIQARARVGFSDEQLKGQLSVGRVPTFGRVPPWQLFVEREYRDLAFAERSGVANSLAAALFGSDYTNQVDSWAAGLQWRTHPASRFTWRVAAEGERATDVRSSGAIRGRFEPTLGAWPLSGGRAEVRGSGGWVAAEPTGMRGSWQLLASAGAYRGRFTTLRSTVLEAQTRTVEPLVGRVQGLLQLSKPLGPDQSLFLQTFGGIGGGHVVPPQWRLFAGGPWSAPGYDYLSFSSGVMASQRVEWRVPVWGPSIPLGRFGQSPPRVVLAPYAQVLATARTRVLEAGDPTYLALPGGEARALRIPRPAGAYASVGLGALFFYDLLRVDVARGLRGGTWRFNVDIDRSFWGML
jgi:hypothetical protein